jgi:predicted membrane GTPase involved in stress response
MNGDITAFRIANAIMQDDEYLEITPKNVRMRKKYLTKNEREKAKKNS